jgi:hypothetical protein
MSTNKSSALFRRTSFTRLQPSVERAVALFLLALSWLGTVLWGGGGWEAWSVLRPYVPGLALGLVLQTFCTGIQWVYSNRWGSLWYLGTVLASTGSSVAGYFPLALLSLPLFGFQPTGVAWWVTLGVSILAGLLLDILPERILVAD